MNYIFQFLIFLFLYCFTHCKVDNEPPKVLEPLLPNHPTKDYYHPIEFYVDYSNLQPEDSFYFKIKNSITKVTESLSVLLEVQTYQEIKVNDISDCDRKIHIDDIIQTGITTDFLLFVRKIDQESLGNKIVKSKICYLQEKDKRPIVGILYISSSISFESINADKYFEISILHELSHILVFSNYLFHYFPSSVQPVLRLDSFNKAYIRTPKVIELAKRHFNCENITEITVEVNTDREVDWESRLMLGDYMISQQYEEMVISEITLGLFEDSHWYKVHYYTGGLFRFGKNQGCPFINGKCSVNNTKPFQEYCSTDNRMKCFAGGLIKGNCEESLQLINRNKYFTTPILESKKEDICPIPRTTHSNDNEYFIDNCKYGISNSFFIHQKEVIGDESICVEHSLSKKNPNIPVNRRREKYAICQKVQCDFDTETVTVFVNDRTIQCKRNQIKAKLAGYEGELICPSFDRVCTGTVWCNDPFECIDKKSLLYVKPKSFSLLSILLKMLYCLLLIVCLLAIVILYLKLHKHRRMKQRRFVEII